MSGPYTIQVPVPGQPISTAQYGIPVRDAINDLHSRLSIIETSARLCKLRQPGTQSIAHATDTKLSFGVGSEDTDVYGWHSETVNPTRITPTLTGWFDIIVKNVWVFNTALNYSDVIIYKNGTITDRLGNQQLPVPNPNNVNKTGGYMLIPLSVTTIGDYFEMGVFQASTGSVSLTTNGGGGVFSPTFSVRYIGAL